MGNKIKFSESNIVYSYDNNLKSLDVVFTKFKEKYLGKKVEVSLCYGTFVKKQTPINDYVRLKTLNFFIENENNISFYDIDLNEPTYFGKSIDVVYFLKITIDDKLIFKDTTGFHYLDISEEYSYKKFSFQKNINNQIIDRINFKKSFGVLGLFSKIIFLTIWAIYFYTIIGLYNPEYIYEGFKNFSIFNVKNYNIVIVIVGLLVSFLLSYLIILIFSKGIKCKFNYKNLENNLKIGKLDGLVNGKVLQNMSETTIGISVSNYEKGIFEKETISYDDDNNKIKHNIKEYFEYCISNYNIFNKKFEKISAGEDISFYIKGLLKSEEFYSKIGPTIYNKYNKNYGLITKIELIIINNEYSNIHRISTIEINNNLFSINKEEEKGDFKNREELY